MSVPIEVCQVMPKVALHDHLDGGLRPSTLVEEARAVGHRLPTTDPDELAGWFPVRKRAEMEPELREWLVYATRTLGAGPASNKLYIQDVCDETMKADSVEKRVGGRVARFEYVLMKLTCQRKLLLRDRNLYTRAKSIQYFVDGLPTLVELN